mmetsp:Transcript_43336/g.106421  ORF Transcript_43336/g.106421 Transcript_43336/m.106421 type:complete len:206 (+) Transcript_43336:228-845(+)
MDYPYILCLIASAFTLASRCSGYSIDSFTRQDGVSFDESLLVPRLEPGEAETAVEWVYSWKVGAFESASNDALLSCHRRFTSNVTDVTYNPGPYNITDLNSSLNINYDAVMNSNSIADFTTGLRVFLDNEVSSCSGIPNDTISFLNLAVLDGEPKSADGIPSWVIGAIGGAIMLLGLFLVALCTFRSRGRVWNEQDYLEETVYTK